MSGMKSRQVVRHSNLTMEIRAALSLVSRNYCSCALCSGNSSTILMSTDLIPFLSESCNNCQRVYQVTRHLQWPLHRGSRARETLRRHFATALEFCRLWATPWGWAWTYWVCRWLWPSAVVNKSLRRICCSSTSPGQLDRSIALFADRRAKWNLVIVGRGGSFKFIYL